MFIVFATLIILVFQVSLLLDSLIMPNINVNLKTKQNKKEKKSTNIPFTA